jgi:glycosyltransferase involved in cell wall biosynthesis
MECDRLRSPLPKIQRRGFAMDRPEVSVLVNTYEKPWHLSRCLVSLACQSFADRMEVVVVDDGSRDETAAVVRGFARTAPFPVKFLSHPHEAFQLCRCRNEGAAASSAERLIFLDGDLVAPRDHIAEHLRHLVPGVVTNSYCARLDEEISKQIDEDLIRSGKFTSLMTRGDLAPLARMYRRAWFYQLIRHPSRPRCKGGDLGVMRSDYERLNGFDENFRAWGGEDDDFGFRLRSAKIRLKYIMNSTRSYHLWHPLVSSRPGRLRDGENEEYLHRPVRLTRCMNGLAKRTVRELAVRICGTATDPPSLERALSLHFRWPQTSQVAQAEVEILPYPGDGRFTRTTEARLLLITEPGCAVPTRVLKSANIVLSPLGDIGRKKQIRLRLEDQAGLAQALGWRPIASRASSRRAA